MHTLDFITVVIFNFLYFVNNTADLLIEGLKFLSFCNHSFLMRE